MKIKDVEIHDYNKLDKILVKLCELIIKGQQKDSDEYGLVGACIVDPDNNIVASTSRKVGDKWSHAEREAMENYENKYGEIPAGCIIVTTLSPCSDTMGDRYHESCTDLINNSPVKKVYCGYIDPTQTENTREFTQLESGNKKIREACKTISDTFLKDTLP